jgi:hypothetical protein
LLNRSRRLQRDARTRLSTLTRANGLGKPFA